MIADDGTLVGSMRLPTKSMSCVVAVWMRTWLMRSAQRPPPSWSEVESQAKKMNESSLVETSLRTICRK
jgi:hypothetical protein